jgi:glycosyltransferase involved in cell wall biosynthesis
MRILAAVPVYNEEEAVGPVLARIRAAVPGIDLLAVDDGSSDRSSEVLAAAGVPTARHLTNLGYGRAIQTALLHARRRGYDALVTLDADGQHPPEQLPGLLAAFEASGADLLVGSRFVATRDYRLAPPGRRLGMTTFSLLAAALTGRRVWDTTSGLRVMRSTVFEPLTRWHFVDFHAEAIVYLSRLGYRIAEHPVTVEERRTGTSMYGLLSAFEYPAKTALMLVLGFTQALLDRRSRA